MKARQTKLSKRVNSIYEESVRRRGGPSTQKKRQHKLRIRNVGPIQRVTQAANRAEGWVLDGWLPTRIEILSDMHTHTLTAAQPNSTFSGPSASAGVEQYIRLIKQNLAISQVENLPNDNKYRAEKTHVKLNRKNNNHVWKKH